MQADRPSTAGSQVRSDAPYGSGAGVGWKRWVRRVSTWALGLSLVIHLVMLLVATLLSVWGGGTGDGPRTPGVVEFAVMPESALESVARDELSLELPTDSQLLESDLDPLSEDLLTTDLAATPAVDRTALELDVGSGGGSVSIDGAAGAGAAGANGGASFFGIEARGNRFAYIVDVSGSMDRDGRLEATVGELNRSVTEMLEHVGFYIVLYSDDAFSLGNRRDWTDADASGKRWARRNLQRLEPLGTTNPLPAFELVFDIRPRPDAIYFMTDGEFDGRIADQIIAMNRERPTPIHCITFVTPAAAGLMQRIADSSNGTYTHIPGAGTP
ncbi:MAG: vWA domain-containing protein [Planctomycetota bacterium]